MAVMASEVKVGQLWKRKTGDYLVVREIKDSIVFFHGTYLTSQGDRWDDENLSYLRCCLRDNFPGEYKLIDDIGYTIGMKFSSNNISMEKVVIIKEFFWNETDGLCVRYEHGGWDSLPLKRKRIEEKEEVEEKQPEQSFYPPADTEPAKGQIWEERTPYRNIWLLLEENNIRLLECSTKWKDPGFEMEFSWKCLENRHNEQIWKCLSLATDKHKVGQVWIDRSQGKTWTVMKVLEGGRANIENQYGSGVNCHFMAPNENWHLIKDVQEHEKKESPERDFSIPAVGDIYEWTGSIYPGLVPGKRYAVKVVSEKHKYIVELENLTGNPHLTKHSKWKLVYKYGSPVRVGKDYVFEKSTGVWLQSQTRWWWRGSQAVYVFHKETGEKVEVTENGFQQNVLSGNWTIYSEEEAWAIKSSLENNSLGSCVPSGIEIDLSQIDDLEEIVSKPTKQENKKMNLIDVMDIKDIQIKQVDEEVIKDKQCELAGLFGYEASGNRKGEVIFRREGKLSGGIVITPVKLVELFEKQIKDEANCGCDSTLEAAINYGIVQNITLSISNNEE